MIELLHADKTQRSEGRCPRAADVNDNDDDEMVIPSGALNAVSHLAAAIASGTPSESVATLPEMLPDHEKAFLRGVSLGGHFGSPLRRFFPVGALNRSCNYGSYGQPPLCVSVAQLLYQTHMIDCDNDMFMRQLVFPKLRNIRRLLADFVGLRDEDELFLVNNAADAMGIIAQSLIFHPKMLARWLTQPQSSSPDVNGKQSRTAKEADGTAATADAAVYRVMMFSNTYPMVQESAAFHINRYLDERRSITDVENQPQRQQQHHQKEEAALPSRPMGDEGLVSGGGGGVRVETVTCPLTVALIRNESALIDHIVDFALSHRVAVMIIDHVSFAPPVVLPVWLIASRIKAVSPNTLVIVDAAHCLGNIPVDFGQLPRGLPYQSSDHLNCPNAKMFPTPGGVDANGVVVIDAWFSNNHKWLTAPKSSATMYIPAAHLALIHPTTPSVFHRVDGGGRPIGGKFVRASDVSLADKVHTEMVWQGTRDFSQFLVLSDVLYFRSLVGEGAIQAYNRQTALNGARRVAEIWGTEILLDDAERLPSLATVRIPEDTVDVVVAATQRLMLQEHHTFVPHLTFDGHVWARFGCQMFNGVADFEVTAKILLEILGDLRGATK